jgi:hypothetical protein
MEMTTFYRIGAPFACLIGLGAIRIAPRYAQRACQARLSLRAGVKELL